MVLEEIYQNTLGRVLDNIMDPNTDPKKKREIQITFTFKPKQDRSVANIDVIVKAKLAGPEPVETVFVLKHDGKGRMLAHEPIQDDLFVQPN